MALAKTDLLKTEIQQKILNNSKHLERSEKDRLVRKIKKIFRYRLALEVLKYYGINAYSFRADYEVLLYNSSHAVISCIREITDNNPKEFFLEHIYLRTTVTPKKDIHRRNNKIFVHLLWMHREISELNFSMLNLIEDISKNKLIVDVSYNGRYKTLIKYIRTYTVLYDDLKLVRKTFPNTSFSSAISPFKNLSILTVLVEILDKYPNAFCSVPCGVIVKPQRLSNKAER
ncbi:hypothetical protein [Vibrio genomosp. F10]|uniref:hypothetical protein n=1 Tax=Vibrio genomosp. F10 TaxID=723171 RepID=UPI00031971A6|nr:hypothetical protein [Vibrio genomosp. F10]